MRLPTMKFAQWQQKNGKWTFFLFNREIISLDIDVYRQNLEILFLFLIISTTTMCGLSVYRKLEATVVDFVQYRHLSVVPLKTSSERTCKTVKSKLQSSLLHGTEDATAEFSLLKESNLTQELYFSSLFKFSRTFVAS